MRRAAAACAALAAVAACEREPLSVRPPTIVAAAVAPNPANVLSAVVTVHLLGDADSAAVTFQVGGVAGSDSAAPAVRVDGDSARIPVLGLLPATHYELRTVAFGGGHVVSGVALAFDTGALPSDLPSYSAGGPDPSPGYVVFAAGKYGVVIDNTGRVVWYRRFEPNGPFLNFQAQPNGRYVALPSTPDPSDVERFVEVDPLGDTTRTLGCAGGLAPRFHDLIAEPSGGYWIMCDETRSMDLRALGGVAAARVTGTVVQHIGAGGALLFSWSPFDHFDIADLDSASRAGASVNWTHGNALDLDEQGNLVVSFRSLSEITSINTTTGAVMWRMGGRRNQFTFTGGPTPAFARQHGVRLTGPGSLELLDNLGDPAASHAERYDFDPGAHTAELVRTMGSSPGVTAALGGTTQMLPAGRVLVAYGNGGRVEEYDGSGAVVWRIAGNPGYIFRAQRIPSLYRPGVGTTR